MFSVHKMIFRYVITTCQDLSVVIGRKHMHLASVIL